jgi:tetratricopeptide (TPR) repeat protein
MAPNDHSSGRAAEIFGKFQLATTLHQENRLAEASILYREIIAKHPEHFESYHRLGLIAAQMRHLTEAVEQFRKTIRINPSFPNGHINLGNALLEGDRPQEALHHYEKALSLLPNEPSVYNSCGLALDALDRCSEAISHYNTAIALRPDYSDAFYNRGNALQKLKQFPEALKSYEQALSLQPDLAHVHSNRGKVLQEVGDLDAALASYDRAIALAPNLAEAHYNRGNALHKLNEHARALESYRQAILLRPDFAEAYSNCGNIQLELQLIDQAIRSYERAIALKPGVAEFHNNLANALQTLGRSDEALASYDQAIALKPEYAEAHVNRGLTLLREGRYGIGWKEYAWRNKAEGFAGARTDIGGAEWKGEPLTGKSVLLYAEQGYGDAIQFMRYVPKVAALGARVLLEVPRRLQNLTSTLDGASAVVVKGDQVPPVDYHCSLLSLPLVFNTAIESIPNSTRYLRADPQRILSWANRFPASSFKIGLAWAGNPNYRGDRTRSIGLSPLVPMLSLPGMLYVSLQKDLRVGDEALMRKCPQLIHLDVDFDDTAAIMCQLNIIVSSDTSAAHLAGALGLPVWVLLEWMPDWRWFSSGTNSPWYPTARLFRQPARGDWNSVIKSVQHELMSLAANAATTKPRR